MKTENTTTTEAVVFIDPQGDGAIMDEMFEQAARNQGFASFKEFAEVSKMTSSEVDPAAIAEHMDDPASAPLVPKTEFKEQFEAWQKKRRLAE